MDIMSAISHEEFMPHGYCLLWQPGLLWSSAVFDILITLSYYSIPLALVYFVRKRTDFEYRWILTLFAAFIVLCGTTHLLGAILLWKPLYYLDVAVKAATALVSVFTAVVMWPLIPKLLALPSHKQLELANAGLKESERRYRLLVGVSPYCIHEIGLDGLMLSMNGAGVAMLGLKEEKEAIGAAYLDAVSGNDKERIGALMQNAFKGATSHFEFDSTGKAPRRFKSCFVPIRDADGNVLKLMGITEDITARKEAEEKLFESENKYRSLFQEMVSGFALNEVVFDEQGEPVDYITLEVTREFERLLGMSKENVIGKKAYETVPGLDRKWLGIFGKVALTGTPYTYVEYASNVGKWFEGTVFSPRKGLAAGTFIDITDRKRAEQALRDHEFHLLQAQRVGGFGSYIYDIKADRWISSEMLNEIFGIGADFDRSAAGWVGFIHPDDRETTQKALLACIEGKKNFDREYRVIRPADGKERWLHGLGEVESGADGRPLRIVGTNTDITVRKGVEEAMRTAKETAEEATVLKDKFVSLVSHDLKAPLASMSGFLKLVRNDYAEQLNDGAKMILDRAVDSGEAMVHLIDDLLTISRFNTGQLKLNRQFFDAEYLGVMIAANYSNLARQKGIKIESTIPANSRIFGDKALLTEAVQNLVTNAIKFCKSGDHITISLAEGDASTICVRDTGPGIHPNLLNALFKFEEKTSSEPGTGFGLPLVKNIVELHGGELEIKSDPGKGCLFGLNLPYVRPKILLVDDDRNFRLMQIMQLRELNADIIEAENGQDALNMMTSVRPDLVITDIQMPVMDGLELLKRVRGEPETKDIPVIAVSSESGMEIRDTVFKFGGDDFITKYKTDTIDFLPRVRRFIG